MNIIIGTSLLILVLAIFTLFNYKAPYGTKAMGALASAACASFLVEAFQDSFFGKVLGFQFLSEVGGANGSLSGVAAAILVAIAIGARFNWFICFWNRYYSWFPCRIFSGISC